MEMSDEKTELAVDEQPTIEQESISDEDFGESLGYNPDDPYNTDEPDDEPEAAEEPETEEAEPEPEPEAEQPEPDTQEVKAEQDDKAARKWDEALAKLNQHNANLEKALASGDVNKAKAEQDKIDALLEKSDEDIDPYGDLKTVANEQKSTKHRIAELEQRLEASNAQNQTIVQEIAQAHRFDKANPGLSYWDLRDQLETRMADFVEPGEQLPPKTWNKLVAREWNSLVETAKSEVASDAPKPTTPKVKKPEATNVVSTKRAKSKSKKSAEDAIDEAGASILSHLMGGEDD
jgi:hypothetical protein